LSLVRLLAFSAVDHIIQYCNYRARQLCIYICLSQFGIASRLKITKCPGCPRITACQAQSPSKTEDLNII